MLRNGDTSVSIFRDALFIQKQGDDDTAVFFHQRKDLLNAFCGAVDRVDHRFSVIAAERAFHGISVGGVDLERKCRHRLQLFHDGLQRGRLVNVRKTGVDVEYISTAVLLLECEGENVLQIMVVQGLFHFFSAGGVDPLADDDRTLAEIDGSGEGGDHGYVLFDRWLVRQVSDSRNDLPDVFRCCAAASADALYAESCNVTHSGSKFFGADVVIGIALAVSLRKAGIRIDDDRQRRGCEKTSGDIQHAVRSETAVDAQRVDAETFEHRGHGFRCSTGHHFFCLVEGHGDEDGKIGVFLCRENGGLRLKGVRHGFDQNEVCALFDTGADDFCIDADRLFEGKIAERLKKLSCGTHIQCDKCVLTAGFFPRLTGIAHSGVDNLLRAVTQLEGIGTEGVGCNNVTAGIQITSVKRDDSVRMFQIPQLRKLTRFQPHGLEQRAGAAVENHSFSVNRYFTAHKISIHKQQMLCDYLSLAKGTALNCAGRAATGVMMRGDRRNAYDSRHRFGRHHHQRIRQRQADFFGRVENPREVCLHLDRTVSVSGREAGPGVQPFFRGFSADAVINLIAVGLDHGSRCGLTDQGIAHFSHLGPCNQAVGANPERGGKEADADTALQILCEIAAGYGQTGE